MIITIAGTPGSGKSTIAPMLKENLNMEGFNYDLVDVGKLRREAAKERNMTISEYNAWSEANPEEGDKTFDDYVKSYAQKRRDLIIVGRMAFHMLPQSVKVFIKVSDEMGAQRIFSDLQNSDSRNESKPSSVEEQREFNKKRVEQDISRYESTYGVNPYDETNFDLIIDSTHLTPEEVCDKVLEKIYK